MMPVKFEHANKVLLPAGDVEDCDELPVYTNGEYCISCWSATFFERLKFLFNGKFFLFVYSGTSQPPVGFKIGEDAFIVNKPKYVSWE